LRSGYQHPKTTGSHNHLAELTEDNIESSNTQKRAVLSIMCMRLSNRIKPNMADAVHDAVKFLQEPISITRLEEFQFIIDYDYTCYPKHSRCFLLTYLRYDRGTMQGSWKPAAHEFCHAPHVAAPARIQTRYRFLQMEEESILVHRGEVGEPDAGTRAIPVECQKVAVFLCCCSVKTASDLVSTESVIQYLQAHLILSVGDLCARRAWMMSQLYTNSSWRCLGQATQQGK